MNRAPSPSAMSRLLTFVLGVATYVLAGTLGLSYLAPFVPPDRFWPFAFLGLAFPYLFWLNLAVLAYWFWRQYRYAYAPLAALVLGLVQLDGFWGLNGKTEADGLRVMTFNARYFDAMLPEVSPEKKAATLKAIQENLRRQKPDLLCGQDFTGDSEASNQAIYQFIRDELGLRYRFYETPSLVTFSRFPIVEQKAVRFAGSYNSYHYIDIERNGQKIRVFNLHLQSNKLGDELDEALRPNVPAAPEAKRAYVTILGKLRRGFSKRAAQARLVAQAIADSPYPVIVCGDFNDTPNSFAYRTVSKGLRDSFRERGSGFGSTYSGALPFLRIDYVLASPSLPIRAHRVVKAAYSDHYAVVAVF